MPDESRTSQAKSWLSDEIVSFTSGARDDSERSRMVVRLGSEGSYLRLQFVSVYVRDQERSLRFFVDQLGFKLFTDVRFASGSRWIEVVPPDGTASLALVLPRADLGEENLVGRSSAITFLTEDIEAKIREWSERGVHFTIPLQAPKWGGAFCRFEDPDGNAFVLAGFDEATREIETQRRASAERIELERRAAQELEIAKQVQARLFPQRLPSAAGLDYAGTCRQARAVGGDYYDFLDLGAERLALVVGDIAGKGIAGALLMASLQANLRSQCAIAADRPDQVLRSVNRTLFENTSSEAYATLFMAEYDAHHACMRYANCGHLPAIVLRADGSVERLAATCPVVGLFEDWKEVVGEACFTSGDTLAIFTDGLTESFNGAGEEFGEERLIAALRRYAALGAEETAQAMTDEVRAFGGSEQFDDITLIIAKRL